MSLAAVSRARLLNLLKLEDKISMLAMVGCRKFSSDTASLYVGEQRLVKGFPRISSQRWLASSCQQESFVKEYPLSLVGNMDETPLWLDMPGETTITRRGERSVPLRTTGHDKGRFTVVLSAMADGRKLKPYVVFKGVRAIPEMNTNGVVVALSKNGWMNEELTKDWVKRVWGSLNFGRRLLMWDAYKCHITLEVRSYVNRHTNTDVSVIPGGLTSHLQPANVSWNKPFKTAYKEKYRQWMATGSKTYTAAGNVRPPCVFSG